jgi:hypothetical protein
MSECILPDVNPIIKNLVSKQFHKPEITEKQYRCNACTKWFPESQTDLYKYNSDSNRRHRLCLKCIKNKIANS